MDTTDDSPIIGIDLGTTNSLVGIVEAGFPILLADENQSRITPSVVHHPAGSDESWIGEKAARIHAIEPARTIRSVKRLIGRRFAELSPEEKAEFTVEVCAGENGNAAIKIGDEILSPEAISAQVIAHLRSVAEAALEHPVTRAVITVPAYFNDAQRNATKHAGELAGLTVERIVNEPTAAALAYGLDKLDENSRIAVYDFGGGTFDLSILELRDGVFQVLSTCGDTRLGGDDIDRGVAAFLADKMGLPKLPTIHQQAQLQQIAREAKEKLSNADEAEIRLPFFQDGQSFETTISKSEFESIAGPIIDRTREFCIRAMNEQGISYEPTGSVRSGLTNQQGTFDEPTLLDRVILVGGSTRIPLVRERVASWFGQEPDLSQNPDETIALGAAIQAGILCGRVKNVVLLDVTPLSLGIETFGGLMNVIIPRNTTIPAKAGELFTNAVANQAMMLVRVLQGEREMARDNWELGRIEIPFEAGPKGSARVGVQFSIDENGILEVLTRDTATNQDTILEIKNAAVDVDDDEVEKMVSESVDYAFDDMNERIWTEAKLKSEELIPSVEQALELAGGDLAEDVRNHIESCLENVKSALTIDPFDLQRLKAANQTLDEATEGLAAILVEKAMEQAFENLPDERN